MEQAVGNQRNRPELSDYRTSPARIAAMWLIREKERVRFEVRADTLKPSMLGDSIRFKGSMRGIFRENPFSSFLLSAPPYPP